MSLIQFSSGRKRLSIEYKFNHFYDSPNFYIQSYGVLVSAFFTEEAEFLQTSCSIQ